MNRYFFRSEKVNVLLRHLRYALSDIDTDAGLEIEAIIDAILPQ